MKISLAWLGEYVDVRLSAQELALALTRAGIGTEAIEEVEGDAILEIETTSNRPDHLGYVGVAREVAWICGIPLRLPPDDFTEMKVAGGKSLAQSAKLRIEDGARCPRYIARLATGVRVAPSPDWLARRLTAIGVRPVNNVVDITNYVLFEWGQPLHAFDLARLQGAELVVRRARAGESFTAINAHKYSLTVEDLVIADRARAVALAGIMGGIDCEVGAGTENVLLESAWFDPVSVRRTSRRLQIASDASYRFERRVDPEGVEFASRRFCHLLARFAGATIVAGKLEAAEPALLAKRTVSVRPARASHLLGFAIDAGRAQSALEAAGFPCVREDSRAIEVEVPSYRHEVTREVDLIEEIARVIGFDSVPDAPLTAFPVRPNVAARRTEGVRAWMIAAGFREALTFSFVEDGEFRALEEWWCARLPFEVRNPVRAPERFLRRSLLPNLLGAMRANRQHGVEDVRLFEVSRVFHRPPEGGRPEERLHLAWVELDRGAELRDHRGIADGVFEYLQSAPGAWAAAGDGLGFSSSESAVFDASGVPSGIIGVLEIDGVAGRVWCGEISLQAEIAKDPGRRRYRDFSRQPAIRRDLNMVMPDATPWAEVADSIRSLALPDLVSLEFVDLYRGKQVPPGRKSVTFSLVFRADDKTLLGDEADQRAARVVQRLGENFGATLRT